MSVKLIDLTPNAEEQILYIARVSSNQENTSTGLIKYLIENKHWSPFEHTHATFEFETTKDVAIQMLRHRSFSFQEFSQRYASPTEYMLNIGRKQADKNRQSSVVGLDAETQEWWAEVQHELYEKAFDTYQFAIEKGIARECARSVLPMATATKLYMTGTLRSWIHYFDLRCDEHTQLEHRLLALEARAMLKVWLPVIADACGWSEKF